MVRLKYSELSSFQFAQAVQKISQTPTHGQKASQIHKVTRALGVAREKVSKEYASKLIDVFAKKDETGKIIRPEGEPQGFTVPDEKQAEFDVAQNEFGTSWVELDCQPFTLELISDMKVSAQDLEALRGLWAGNVEVEKTTLSSVK